MYIVPRLVDTSCTLDKLVIIIRDVLEHRRLFVFIIIFIPTCADEHEYNHKRGYSIITTAF